MDRITYPATALCLLLLSSDASAGGVWPRVGGGAGAHRMAGRWPPKPPKPVIWPALGGGSGAHRMAGRWPPKPLAHRSEQAEARGEPAGRPRWREALPNGGDALDRHVLGVALPSMVNLAVIPLVGAVDTFWVGRMGDALALAGQGAANQCFFSVYFLIAFIPTITAPLVAKAAGSGNTKAAAERVCEALFLANVLGFIGTIFLVASPQSVLGLVLPAGAPATAYAIRYLRLRSLSLIPALVASVGFSAYRGLLDNVTPLKVSLASNLLNLVLDPVLIFGAGMIPRMGVAGAALATAAAEVGSGVLYLVLLLKKKMVEWRRLITPPALADLIPLIRGGAAMLLRQAALNVAFVSATRRTQAMDPTGVAAAAYSISNQLYSLGLVVMLAIQATGATLIPAALAAASASGTTTPNGADANRTNMEAANGDEDFAPAGVKRARQVADRLIGWSTVIALTMAALQIMTLPWVTPLFSTLPEVRRAVRAPAMMAAVVQMSNGPLFACEGILMGVGGFGFLAGITCAGVATMVGCLALSAKLNLGLVAVWGSLLAFHVVQLSGVLYHFLKVGPLAAKPPSGTAEAAEAAAPVECTMVPEPMGGNEVCLSPAT